MSLWSRVFAERRRTVLGLMILLIVNVAVLALAVLPLQTMVASAHSRAETAKLDVAQAQTQLRQAQAAHESRDRAQKDLKKFYGDVLPPNLPSARHITDLEIARIGQDSGLKPGTRTFDVGKIKNSHLGEFKTEVEFTGEYASIRRFIYDLETSESFLVVRSVALAQASQQKSNNPGSLQVVVQVSTFYLDAK